MNKTELLQKLQDIEWDDFEVKEARSELPKNIWENLWEYYFAIIERLKRQVNMPFKMNELGIAVEDSPQFDAIREALINLLMHTDYFSQMKPRVRIFSDRIEFENPGAFPRPIKELLKKDVSLPRNPVIAKLFRCAKLADNAGYGFDKMLKWEKSTHTKVCFENSVDVALVTFKIDGIVIENIEDSAKESEKVPEKVPEKITDNQLVILKSIEQNRHITIPELSAIVKISERKVRENISKLKSKGLIERVGPDKGGYWKVKI